MDAAAEALGGLYYCDRDWSAWSYGTMHADDFSEASDDDNIPADVAKAMYSAMQIPPPSACADPVRLARISPETVRAWLGTKGWRWFGSQAMAIPDGRRPTYEIELDLGVTLRVLAIAAEALDIYPGHVLAELEAMEETK